MERIINPCNGYCTTSLGDKVCRSCIREVSLVSVWSRADTETKLSYWHSLDMRVSRYLEGKISLNEPLLIDLASSIPQVYKNVSIYLIFWQLARFYNYNPSIHLKSSLEKASVSNFREFFLNTNIYLLNSHDI